ncbi:hypothetical protein [Phenylobacterium sp.]|uniref:hypothetical protein n=1 Tax=Phenylobacterium sp. TaxID=1871053 RepID=UPI003BA9404C
MRRLMIVAVAASLGMAQPVLAADPAPSASLARGCTAKAAKAAEPAEVAANPAEFAGKCVSLEGWWRDIALYPSRAEAAQTDALSIVILDQRRVGLYLPKAQLDAAPQTAPRLVRVVGRVGGACATVAAEVRDKDDGYCHYKPGVWLAVAGVTPK